MVLTSGTKLGAYEIQPPLGAGGIGDVYRARDTYAMRALTEPWRSKSGRRWLLGASPFCAGRK
jgi:hypothetical protein